MDWHRPSSAQLIISDLNDIAADAYRHRIRPRSKRGGNGVYDASKGGILYQLPPRQKVNCRARFEIVRTSADTILVRATSLEDSSTCITAVVDGRGRLTEIQHPTSALTRTTPERVRPSRPIDAIPLKSAFKTVALLRVLEDER